MMRTDDRFSDDVGPDAALQRALDALPTERTLPAQSWEKLQDAMHANAESLAPSDARATVLRLRAARGFTIATLAAVLGVVVLDRHAALRDAPQPLSATPLLGAAERQDPRVLAVLDGMQTWQRAANDPVRAARWPVAARAAIDASLSATERALTEVRGTLARNPDDAVARAALTAIREQQLVLLQRAMALLDEL
jgi:hypothetical protein